MKKDPGLPPGIQKMDSIDVIYNDTIEKYGITYVEAKLNYLLLKFSYDEAIVLAKEYFEALPNIKTVNGLYGIELEAYNGDKTKLLIGSSASHNFSLTFGPNGVGSSSRLAYVKNCKRDVYSLKNKLMQGYAIFYFKDTSISNGYVKIFFSNRQGKAIINELYYLRQNDSLNIDEKYEYLKKYVFRGNAIDKYIIKLIEEFDYDINPTEDVTTSNLTIDDVVLATNLIDLKIEKSDNCSYSSKSITLNFGAAATWGTQYLGLNPSFQSYCDDIISFVIDQGYDVYAKGIRPL